MWQLHLQRHQLLEEPSSSVRCKTLDQSIAIHSVMSLSKTLYPLLRTGLKSEYDLEMPQLHTTDQPTAPPNLISLHCSHIPNNEVKSTPPPPKKKNKQKKKHAVKSFRFYYTYYRILFWVMCMQEQKLMVSYIYTWLFPSIHRYYTNLLRSEKHLQTN